MELAKLTVIIEDKLSKIEPEVAAAAATESAPIDS